MSSERDNILEFNQYRKSDKMPYIVYGHIESLIKKIGGFTNNQENFLITKIGEEGIFLADIRYRKFGHLKTRLISRKRSKKLCKNISYQKFRDHYHYTGKYRDAEHSICNLRFNAPHEILAVFHNSSNYDYHCIINELAKKFEGKFKCPDENTGKYKRFAVPIAKEVIKIGKDVRVL